MAGSIDNRFGAIAVKKGFVTKEQIVEAMNIQIEQDLEGMEHRLIGSILYNKGYITIPQLTEILELIKKM